MNMYLVKNKQNSGPYTEREILGRIKAGEVTGDDLVWCEGGTQAVPISQLIVEPTGAQIGFGPYTFSTAALIFIGKKQIQMIWLTFFWLLLGLMPTTAALRGFVGLGFWMVHISGMFLCWQLASVLRKNVWLWLFATLIPFINLFAFARIVSQAANALKAGGIPSGVCGADRKALARLERSQWLKQSGWQPSHRAEAP